MIRIQTTRKMRHFATIVQVNDPAQPGDDVLINFAPALPANCMLETDKGWVAPISTLRYFVQNTPIGFESERIANTTGPVGQLIRREVRPDDKITPLANNPGNTRAVLDYVVAFNLAFTMNGNTPPNQPDNYAPGVLAVPPSSAVVNANPERIRAVAIELAVRTPEQDRNMPWTQAGCANLRCFQVFPSSGAGARQGSARVRRERAEVFVPNVAFEGY
jgi:hypothetical protein